MKATLTNTAVAAIGSWVAADTKVALARTKAIDLLFADGIRAADCVAPEKGADRTLYDHLRAAIVTGFPADVRKLLSLDKAVMKGKGEEIKADRRTWQQQIGSKLKDLKAALLRREEAETAANMTDEEKAEAAAEAAASATDSARLLRDVTAWINRLEKAEATELPVVDCLKHLKALAGIASASMPH
jgi:hypothetical protein